MMGREGVIPWLPPEKMAFKSWSVPPYNFVLPNFLPGLSSILPLPTVAWCSSSLNQGEFKIRNHVYLALARGALTSTFISDGAGVKHG